MKIKIKQFVINIKISFLILTLVMIALGMTGQFFMLIMLALLHELCHIMSAQIYGVSCKEIVITPAGFYGVINIENMSCFRKLIVLFSGPIFNIALGLILNNNMSIALGIFNLLPIYPLDGGKILNCILGYAWGTLRANRYIVSLSTLLCFVMIMLGFLQMILFFGNTSLLIVGIYLYSVNKNNGKLLTYGFYKAIIHKPNNRVMKTRIIAVNKNTSLKTIIYRLGTDYYSVIWIRDEGKISIVSEDKLQNYIIENGISGVANDLISF